MADIKKRYAIDFTIPENRPFDENMKAVREAGFENIMFGFYDYDTDFERELYDILNTGAKYGVETVNVHLPFSKTNLLWLDGPDRADVLKKMLEYTEIAGKNGIKSLTVHPTSGPENRYVSPLGTDAFMKICMQAGMYGTDICLENLRTPKHLDYIFDSVSLKNLKFCHDTGHNRAFNKDKDFAQKYAKRLGFTHIHDNDEKNDLHRVPGTCSIDFGKIRESYIKAKYKGYLCLELNVNIENRKIYGDLETFLNAAYKALDERFGDMK